MQGPTKRPKHAGEFGSDFPGGKHTTSRPAFRSVKSYFPWNRAVELTYRCLFSEEMETLHKSLEKITPGHSLL